MLFRSEEAVFVPLYILASFVKNKVPIGVWVYFWALCFEEYIDIDIVTDIFFWLHNTVCGTLVP